MKQYKLIDGDSENELEEEVTRLLNEGWQLAGGVNVSVLPYVNDVHDYCWSYIYWQAMTREQ